MNNVDTYPPPYWNIGYSSEYAALCELIKKYNSYANHAISPQSNESMYE
jgi:hypothetical protein